MDDDADADDVHARDGIIAGRPVRRVKQERARTLRRTMTTAEALLLQHLRANQVDGLHWRRQQVIDGFIADFYCHAAGVVIEIDGPIHAQQAAYDETRDRVLAARHLLILRFTNDHVTTRLDGVLARIRAACQTRLRR